MKGRHETQLILPSLYQNWRAFQRYAVIPAEYSIGVRASLGRSPGDQALSLFQVADNAAASPRRGSRHSIRLLFAMAPRLFTSLQSLTPISGSSHSDVNRSSHSGVPTHPFEAPLESYIPCGCVFDTIDKQSAVGAQ